MTSKPLASLDLAYPIFQAPIGSVASAELASGVSNAGGLGHLACTWRSPEQLRILFGKMRALTAKPYGANFVLDFPIEDRLAVALEHGVRVISFFWADASVYLARVKSEGAVAIQVVGSIGEAKRAADAGFDLIVAQGREAGGHVRGDIGTMALVPQIVDAVAPLPVLAAGGIADPARAKWWHDAPTDQEFRAIFLGHRRARSPTGRKPWPSMQDKPSDWSAALPRPLRSSKSWRRGCRTRVDHNTRPHSAAARSK
jgi:NAD(P)H-dependent flavin oxidoreductase YrpB (nitropropane dioxygenase family)